MLVLDAVGSVLLLTSVICVEDAVDGVLHYTPPGSSCRFLFYVTYACVVPFSIIWYWPKGGGGFTWR